MILMVKTISYHLQELTAAAPAPSHPILVRNASKVTSLYLTLNVFYYAAICYTLVQSESRSLTAKTQASSNAEIVYITDLPQQQPNHAIADQQIDNFAHDFLQDEVSFICTLADTSLFCIRCHYHHLLYHNHYHHPNY